MDNGQLTNNQNQPFFTEGVGNLPKDDNPDVNSINSDNYDERILGDMGNVALSSIEGEGSSVNPDTGPKDPENLPFGQIFPPIESEKEAAGSNDGKKAPDAPSEDPIKTAKNLEDKFNGTGDAAGLIEEVQNFRRAENEENNLF